MLRIFSRLRKSLIESFAIRKYFLYAVGEIALVVLGILIALAVNDWRNNNTNRSNELLTLYSLKKEFEETRINIERYIAESRKIITTNHHLNQYRSIPDGQFKNNIFDSLFYNAAWSESLHLNQGILSEIIYSGRLSSISNDQLRISISSWGGRFELAKQSDDDGLDYLIKKIIDYFDKKIAWMYLSKYDRNEVSIDGSIATQIDRKKLSKELEFENFIYMQIWNAENKIRDAQSLLELNLTILEQIDQTIRSLEN